MIISQNDPRFSEIQNIKRKFFALRNGALAAQLKSAGQPYRIIFGLTFVQLREIARSLNRDAAIAQTLFADTHVRESRLLAPMLMPPEAVDIPAALNLLANVLTPEEADILCNQLLRLTHIAPAHAASLYAESSPALIRYAALRLMAATLPRDPHTALQYATREIALHNPLTLTAARLLAADAQLLLSPAQ